MIFYFNPSFNEKKKGEKTEKKNFDSVEDGSVKWIQSDKASMKMEELDNRFQNQWQFIFNEHFRESQYLETILMNGFDQIFFRSF